MKDSCVLSRKLQTSGGSLCDPEALKGEEAHFGGRMTIVQARMRMWVCVMDILSYSF